MRDEEAHAHTGFLQDRIVAVNLVHVFDGTAGKFLATTYEIPPGCVSGLTRLWTPPAIGSPGPGIFETTQNCRTYLFCQGQSALSDGRILLAGGYYTPAANLFDPMAPLSQPENQWNQNQTVPPPNMAYGRWYPTLTTLGNGRVLVTSGWHCDPQYPTSCPDPWVRIPELYDPATNTWTQLQSAYRQQPLYPTMLLLPNGNLLDAGPGESRILFSSTWTWGVPLPDPTWPVPLPPQPGYPGAAVMFEPGKVMKCGGQDRQWTRPGSSMPTPMRPARSG